MGVRRKPKIPVLAILPYSSYVFAQIIVNKLLDDYTSVRTKMQGVRACILDVPRTKKPGPGPSLILSVQSTTRVRVSWVLL